MVTKDGKRIAAEVGPELDYLSRVSRELGVVDLVHDFFDPLVGDWNDLREEAERWRKAAKVTEAVTEHVSAPLGGVDARWEGKDADAFLDHMRRVGLAGGDMSDAMNAMADALEETADGVRVIVQDMAHVLADVADSVSGTASLPLGGDQRAVRHIEEVAHPVRELHESARQVLEAFLKLCDGVSGEADGFGAVRMEHRYPEQNWTYTAPSTPETKMPEPARASATAAASTGASPGGAVGGGGGRVGGGVGGSAGTPAAAEQPMQFGGATGVAEQVPAADRGASAGQAAAAAGGRSGAAPGGMGMMGGMAPMMGAMGGQQGGGDKEHKPKQRITGSIEDLLGKPKKAAPKSIGDD
ncbi:WXG100 family type VII secretion target [Lentzea sp. HUAS12]|uniref:WXG100 family type VII secretion target n=1 Tax=Lentzea sp. HUAS12 TaxID=2951806 RepID=UPI00209DA440|nr:WXG100 family type VII secretion target [Lentzea sp. HUAS12]USX50716.1 WXG100 family type VII secretion target [Lentzea sp. HUAS12]